MLAEKYKIVPIMNTANFGAALASDSINMKNYHKATIIVTLGAVAGAGLVLQVYSGLTDAALTTALAFRYAHGSAAIGSALCDVLEDWTIAATTGWAIADASHDNYMAVIEVKAIEMTGNWLTVYPNAGSSGIAHMVAILQPRYKSGVSGTALA